MSNLFPFTDTDPFGLLMVTTLLNNFVLAVLEELKVNTILVSWLPFVSIIPFKVIYGGSLNWYLPSVSLTEFEKYPAVMCGKILPSNLVTAGCIIFDYESSDYVNSNFKDGVVKEYIFPRQFMWIDYEFL